MVTVTVTPRAGEVKRFVVRIEINNRGDFSPDSPICAQVGRSHSRPSVRTRLIELLREDPGATWRADQAVRALGRRGTPVVSANPYVLVATTLAGLVRGGLASRVGRGVYSASVALQATQRNTAA